MSIAVWDRPSPNIGMAPAEPDLLDGRFLHRFNRRSADRLHVRPTLVQLLLHQAGCGLADIATAQLRVPGRLKFVRGEAMPEVRLEPCPALVEGECVPEMADRVVRRGEGEAFRNDDTNG